MGVSGNCAVAKTPIMIYCNSILKYIYIYTIVNNATGFQKCWC